MVEYDIYHNIQNSGQADLHGFKDNQDRQGYMFRP